MQLDRLQALLRIARRVVHFIVEGAYILLNLQLALLRLLIIGPLTSLTEALAEIEFWFVRGVLLFYDTLEEIGKLLFRVVFDTGGFGAVMKIIIRLVCRFANWAIDIWNVAVCGFVKEAVPAIIRGVAEAIKALTFGGFERERNDMERAALNIESVSCQTNFTCNLGADQRDPPAPIGALPVPTRCWTDFTPQIDTWDTLSCTASDTCRVTTLEAGVTLQDFGGLAEDDGRQIVCEACPFDDENSNINQFGCDPYTKQCTCSRPKTDKTLCSTNAECRFQVKISATDVYFLIAETNFALQKKTGRHCQLLFTGVGLFNRIRLRLHALRNLRNRACLPYPRHQHGRRNLHMHAAADLHAVLSVCQPVAARHVFPWYKPRVPTFLFS